MNELLKDMPSIIRWAIVLLVCTCVVGATAVVGAVAIRMTWDLLFACGG